MAVLVSDMLISRQILKKQIADSVKKMEEMYEKIHSLIPKADVVNDSWGTKSFMWHDYCIRLSGIGVNMIARNSRTIKSVKELCEFVNVPLVALDTNNPDPFAANIRILEQIFGKPEMSVVGFQDKLIICSVTQYGVFNIKDTGKWMTFEEFRICVAEIEYELVRPKLVKWVRRLFTNFETLNADVVEHIFLFL